MAGVQYSLNIQNNSTQTGSFCVYQVDPNINDPNVMSLAWFAKAAAPTTTLVFDWTIDYSFVWAETGVLLPGVQFVASQSWQANLTTTNQVGFTYNGTNDVYTFQKQTQGPQGGTLYIREDNTIPSNVASVGIGMSGAGTFVQQAQPNMNLLFTPTPQYWITFGNFIQGEVLDILSITNAQQLSFPAGVYGLNVALNGNNTWSVTPGT